MRRRRCYIARAVVSLVHGLIAPAGATGYVSSYAQSWNDMRLGVVFNPGQGVHPAQTVWPVEGWNVREGEYIDV